MPPLSIRHTLAGRHVFLTGASGFLGKAWLALVLDQLPELGRLTILMRPRRKKTGLDRFEDMINHSPVLAHLHEKHGAKLADFLAARVEIVEGSVERPDFGLDDRTLERLAPSVDLLLHSAGLTDFDPDPRDSLDTNIDGTIHALELCRRFDRARLLHVSTCFVAGCRRGRIPETVPIGVTPNDKSFDPEAEVREMRDRLDEVVSRVNEGRVSSRAARRDLVETVRERAGRLGWPNTYTYGKALAEMLLVKRAGDVPYTIFRPAIIEGAVDFPFPGWNEGFNGCGPLAYLLATWFRQFPARRGNPFDIVPIDEVTRALTMSLAALQEGIHPQVTHCGTSDRNLCTIDRAGDLTALAHRRHLRKSGASLIEREILSRWDGVGVEHEPLMSLANLRSLARDLSAGLRSLSQSKALGPLSNQVGRFALKVHAADRRLKPIERMVEAYRPFTQTHNQVFESRFYQTMPLEEPEFEFKPERIDWKRWWIDVEMPGLRKWCFPKFEGREIEQHEPRHPVRLPRAEASPGDPAVAKPSSAGSRKAAG